MRNIIGKHPTGLCECGRPETVQHVFLERNKHNRERKTFYQSQNQESFSI